MCCVLFGSPKPTIARQSYEFIADWLKGGSKNSVFRVIRTTLKLCVKNVPRRVVRAHFSRIVVSSHNVFKRDQCTLNRGHIVDNHAAVTAVLVKLAALVRSGGKVYDAFKRVASVEGTFSV